MRGAPVFGACVALAVLACGESDGQGGAGGEAGTPSAGGANEGGAPSGAGGAGPEGAASSGGENTGGAPDLQWGCLGEVQWPKLEQPNMEAELQFFDEADPTVLLEGALVKACLREDMACAEPADSDTTDDQGRVVLSLSVPADSAGWTGYFEISGLDGYPLNLIPTVRPYTNDPNIGFGLVSDESVAGGAFLLTGAAPDPTRGHIAAIMFDCADQATAGVEIAVAPSDGAAIGYFLDGLPSLATTETDATGLALAANVEPGLVSVTATLGATADLIGVTEIPVRAGAITTFGLVPTP